MASQRIIFIEQYVRRTQLREAAHDYKHVDRVRIWAIKIAANVGYPDRDVVEATALLHDIGLVLAERKNHAVIGAETAAKLLREHGLFSSEDVEQTAHAIRSNNSLKDDGILAGILKDADILDMLGAVGIMRAFTSKHMFEEYDRANVKGETWGITSEDTTRRFAAGLGIGPTIVDQINFQISCQGNLRSTFAKDVAVPLVEYMRSYVLELEKEIERGIEAR